MVFNYFSFSAEMLYGIYFGLPLWLRWAECGFDDGQKWHVITSLQLMWDMTLYWLSAWSQIHWLWNTLIIFANQMRMGGLHIKSWGFSIKKGLCFFSVLVSIIVFYPSSSLQPFSFPILVRSLIFLHPSIMLLILYFYNTDCVSLVPCVPPLSLPIYHAHTSLSVSLRSLPSLSLHISPQNHLISVSWFCLFSSHPPFSLSLDFKYFFFGLSVFLKTSLFSSFLLSSLLWFSPPFPYISFIFLDISVLVKSCLSELNPLSGPLLEPPAAGALSH